MPSPSVILNCKKTIAQSYLNLNMLITLIFEPFFSTVIGVIWTSPQEIPIDFIHGSFSRPSRAGGRSQRRNAKWFCAFMGLEAQECEDLEKQIQDIIMDVNAWPALCFFRMWP